MFQFENHVIFCNYFMTVLRKDIPCSKEKEKKKNFIYKARQWTGCRNVGHKSYYEDLSLDCDQSYLHSNS